MDNKKCIYVAHTYENCVDVLFYMTPKDAAWRNDLCNFKNYKLVTRVKLKGKHNVIGKNGCLYRIYSDCSVKSFGAF